MNHPPKKRPWLQYSLSTVVLTMLVASGFIWANMQLVWFESKPFDTGGDGGVEVREYEGYGWPLPFWNTELGFRNDVKFYHSPREFKLAPAPAAVCLLTFIAIILGIATLSEWYVRRGSTG